MPTSITRLAVLKSAFGAPSPFKAVAAVFGLALLAACGNAPDAPTTDEATAAPAAEHDVVETGPEQAVRLKYEAAKEAGYDHPGEKVYAERCASCHDKAEAMRAPNFAALQATSPPQLRYALTQGKMKQQSAGLDDTDIAFLIQYLSPGGTEGYVVPEAAKCETTDISFETIPVSHWGGTPDGARHYSAEQTSLTLADAKDGLELAWAFGFPEATSARSAPVITDDTLFVSANSGHVFALNRETGCIKWHQYFETSLRGPLTYGTVKGAPALFFSDVSLVVHALDAKSGDLLWKKKTAISDMNMGTGGPAVSGNTLFVPMSAIDVGAAMNPEYECCKGHGAVVALNTDTGETLWTTHMTPDPEPTTLSSVGTQLYGPSGAPVWSTPAVDAKNGRIYIGTGENTSAPATDTSDAMIALDMKTGEIIWKFQATENDMFNMACSPLRGSGPNCPEPAGPDYDFGGGLSMATLTDGREVVVGGQKSGDVHVVDAATGENLWTTKISAGSALGGIHWGVTVSGGQVYAPSSDPDFPIPGYSPKPGLTALDLETGEILWAHKAERDCKMNFADRGKADTPWPDCVFAYGYSAAPASTDEFVTLGALDGKLKIFDAKTGDIVWMYDTKREFETLNGISAHGGAIDSVAPVMAGDMLYAQSGYSVFSQMPGNVLLAFRPKSKD